MSDASKYQPIHSKMTGDGLPRIEYDMRQRKLAIAITWAILFLSSAGSPIILYFALRYAAHLELGTALGVASALFGVFSIFSLGKRTWALVKPSSSCRPLGASRFAMDYFNWNFIAGFIVITAVVVSGNVIKNIRLFAMGIPILITEVSLQMLLVGWAHSASKRAPFRLSSVPKGDRIRSGVYILAEDIIAVDAGQGKLYRRQLRERYEASITVRQLCFELDLMWGVTGTLVGAGTILVLWLVPETNVAFVLGFTIPWAYAVIMGTFTLIYCQLSLRTEKLGMFGAE